MTCAVTCSVRRESAGVPKVQIGREGAVEKENKCERERERERDV
jgi:hypothetical protein